MDYNTRLIALFLGILAICMSFYIPALSLIVNSFTANEGFGALLFQTLTDSLFWSAFSTTFTLSIFTSVIVVGLAVPFTYFLLSQSERSEKLFVFIVLTSMLTSLLLRTFSWFAILSNQGPLINTLKTFSKSNDFSLLFTRSSVLVGMTHVLLPIGILCLWTILKPNDRDFRMISRQFGGSERFFFFKNYLPRARKPAILTICLIFVLAFGFHLSPSLLGGGSGDTMTIGVLIDEQVNRFGNWEKGAAYSIVLIGVLFIPVVIGAALTTLYKKLNNEN